MARKIHEDGRIEFATKLSKDDDAPKTTVASMVWDGVTEDMLKTYATRALIIDQQAIYRKNEHVPSEDTINVKALMERQRGGGFKFTPQGAVKKINALPDDEYAETLRGLGMTEKQVEAMLAKRQKAQ